MACLGRPGAALQPLNGSATAPHAAARPAGSNGGAPSWRRGGGVVPGTDRVRLGGRSQLPFAACTLAAIAAASSGGSSISSSSSRNGSDSGSSNTSASPKRPGRPLSPVPDVDAEQLLRSLGLYGTADPATLLRNLRKLPGVRQQGVLEKAAAVTAHLLSPAVGLTTQQAGQLLECCPLLFSWPPEQRVAVLFGQLLGAGLTAADAAACLMVHSKAAQCTTLAPGLAELAAILAHSQDRQGRQGMRAAVPAAQRTVAALLSSKPSAVLVVCQGAGYLQQRASELQQAGFTPADVAALAWWRPELLHRDAAAKLTSRGAVLQQELGLTAAQVISLVASRKPSWLTSSESTLQARAAALVQGFGQVAAAAMLLKSHSVLYCDPAVWWRNLCYMAACGVADPKAVLRRCPLLLHVDQAAPDFLQRRLLLQRVAQLTAPQLYEQHPGWLRQRKVPDLAQRLQFVEHRGRDAAQLLAAVLYQPLPDLLAAGGASQAEWEAWAAANPPEACPLYGWAQQAAEEEAARLAAALPPELAQWEWRPHSAGPRWRNSLA
ncbi:hypothetical protein COHA_008525 [Chlorella ohadii]|uniref:Uncharacterized protein n=1 Tax=Chlorella ohadii TaxID=2649997 RepID=A0AAD5H1I0_9CHLO|nr:hypothetical protein COHA_008525 [Chlorella ohadii]